MKYLEKNVENTDIQAGFFVAAFYYNNEKSDKNDLDETGRPVL